MNAAVANINKFVGETFKVITDGIKNNFEKSCPEVLAIAKDQQSPVKDAVKKLEEAYGVLKKLQVDPAKADVVATAITAVNNFIAELTGFASQLGQQNQGQQQPQQNVNQQPAQNNTPTANNQPGQNNAQPTNPAPAAPAQNNTQPQQQQAVNASKEYADFGHILQEKLRMKTYEKALWRQQ